MKEFEYVFLNAQASIVILSLRIVNPSLGMYSQNVTLKICTLMLHARIYKERGTFLSKQILVYSFLTLK